MKKVFVFTLLTATVLLVSCATNRIQPIQTADLSLKTPAQKEIASRERAKLEIPESILREARRNVNMPDRALGFNAEELDRYGGSDFRLRQVPRLFAEATRLPRYSGRLADAFLAQPDDFSGATSLGFSLLGVSGGRGVEPPKEGWGVDWLKESTGTDEAFVAILEQARKDGIENLPDGKAVPTNDEIVANWKTLPDGVRKLTIKLIIAAVEAKQVLKDSFDQEFLLTSVKSEKAEDLSAARLYKFLSSPWADNEDTPPRAAFEAMERFDIKYLCFGSACYLKYAQAAINEFREWKKSNSYDLKDFKKLVFTTTAGKVCITGTGSDEISGDYGLVIDTGGDDIYMGRTALPNSAAAPISAVIDIGGNDKYDSGAEPAGLASGINGIGAIFDLEGNDTYTCQNSGIASAWYGTGLLVDYSGNDTYNSSSGYALGSGFFGVGMLIDLAGDDAYNCVKYSGGFGGTLGAGLLLDVSGNDTYKSKGEPEPSSWGENRVSMSFGAGMGRRADFGDGHNLAGGIGMLFDGAGDDNYQSGGFSFGFGYWWSIGLFEDRTGNDTYSAPFYSHGAAAHFALGSMVDRAGNDTYCPDKQQVINSFGEGRDGSIGVFYEAEGNDHYHGLGYRCAGNSDLNSIGLCWDRCGDDTYETVSKLEPKTDHPIIFGSACRDGDEPMPTEPIPNAGIFLDTGGADTYTNTKEDIKHQASNNSQWQHLKGPIFWGFGLDIDWYLPATENK